MAAHAEPVYATVFVVTVSQPLIVLFGALYRQVVAALNGDTDEYVPPVTDTIWCLVPASCGRIKR